MIRLDRNVSPADGPLQQAPVVLKPVSVYIAIDVLYRVIHNLMGEVSGQSVVRKQRIAIERGTRLHMLSDFGLKRFLLAARDYRSTNPSAARQNAHRRKVIVSRGAGGPAPPLRNPQISRLSSDGWFCHL